MVNRNVRVFELDPSDLMLHVYKPLLKAKGLSGRGETRVSRKIREAIRDVLRDTVKDAFRDGSAPYRTGRGQRAMLGGIRAFGTTFGTLRGHIIGPGYMAAHEQGATIRPRKAKALAIPLPAALRPDGTPKLPGPRSWKNVVNSFIFKSKKTGRAYIAYKNADGKLTLLYSLVEEAQLSKYKGFISRSWEKQKPELLAAIGQAMFYEMGQVDLLSLARVTYKGRSKS